jgi:hypothetical protein
MLNDCVFPPNLHADTFITTHDDNDGDPASGQLIVSIDEFGDVHLSMIGRYLRFRTFSGGGKFLKIRNALLLLADAIRQEGRLE